MRNSLRLTAAALLLSATTAQAQITNTGVGAGPLDAKLDGHPLPEVD